MKTSPLKTVILSAPQGWGKTRNAEALRLYHGCTTVVDDWCPPMTITLGALHLTNVPTDLIDAPYMLHADLVSRGWVSVAA